MTALSASRCACGADWDTVEPDGYTCSRRHFVPRAEMDVATSKPTRNGHIDRSAGVGTRRESPASPAPATTTPSAVMIKLAHVQPETVTWLWSDRIPLGKLTIKDGDPGLGKSAMALDLGARVSAGRPMPDDSTGDLEGPAGVVILSAEDGLADTIRPRLDAAGADCTRIVALEEISETKLERRGDEEVEVTTTRLPTVADLDAIKQAIEQVDAKLLIVDPLSAFLPAKVNSYIDPDVRRALAPLAKLADELSVAVLAVRHLSKAGGANPLYRGGGSIAILGAARSGLLVAADPSDPDRRVLAVSKSNLAKLPASLSYTIEPAPNGSIRVRWCGESEHSAKSLLAEAGRDDEERSALDDACDVLRDLLSSAAVNAKEIVRLAREAGISERTIYRAKSRLGVRTERFGFGREMTTMWRLETSVSPTKRQFRQSRQAGNVGETEELGETGEPGDAAGSTPADDGRQAVMAQNRDGAEDQEAF